MSFHLKKTKKQRVTEQTMVSNLLARFTMQHFKTSFTVIVKTRRSRGGCGHCVVSLGKTFSQCLSVHQGRSINGYRRKMVGVNCDGLASYPGRVATHSGQTQKFGATSGFRCLQFCKRLKRNGREVCKETL